MKWHIVEHEGHKRRVALHRDAQTLWVGWEGGLYRIPLSQDNDTRDTSSVPAEGHIIAPLTAKVVVINVKEGDEVKAGQTLMMLEAMKMEYNLSAPVDGSVVSMACKEGDLVDRDQRLMEIGT
jgi:biotin carboxyl carrier protein